MKIRRRALESTAGWDLKNLKPGDVSAAPVSGRLCLLLPIFDQSSGFRFSWTHAA